MRQMIKRKDTYEHGKKAPVDLTAPLQVKTDVAKTFLYFTLVKLQTP